MALWRWLAIKPFSMTRPRCTSRSIRSGVLRWSKPLRKRRRLQRTSWRNSKPWCPSEPGPSQLVTSSPHRSEIAMAGLRLSFACGPYDRTQALRDETIRPEGIELKFVAGQPAEIFWRMLQYQEFDISEMSMSNYISLVGAGDSPFIAIPVFLSRVFRHGFIFVNSNSGINAPSDLIGKRGGVPEYSQTAAVMARGVLEHEYSIKPSQIRWVQGRADRMLLTLPSDVHVEP